MSAKLTHLDDAGRAMMVDVGNKPISVREATAEGFIYVARETLAMIADAKVPKGDVFAVARIAGIMAAKKCGELIPLCHPLPLESVEVGFDFPQLENVDRVPIRIYSKTRITAKTGIEMEALTAVSIAALTIYDMCKAIDKEMRIGGVRLLSKTKTVVT